MSKATFKESAYLLTDFARKTFHGSNETFLTFQKLIEKTLDEVLITSRRIGPCTIPRLDWDNYYMLQAHLVATRSTCDRGPELLFDPPRKGVGAVIVKDNRLIATGYNGSPPGEGHCDDVGHMMIEGHCVATLHGEENALLQCAIDGVSPVGATVFTTASPCWDCSKRLVRVGIKRLIYANDYDSRYGLSKSAYGMLTRAGIELIHLDVRKALSEF